MENGKTPQLNMESILHHKVQSINNKLLELNLLLQSELVDVAVLCLSEHWLREENIKLIRTDKFKLASNFSRSKLIMVVPVFMLNTLCKLRKYTTYRGLERKKTLT
jgi:hypothetical protein